MEKEKAERIITIYNCVRAILFIALFLFVLFGLGCAQAANDSAHDRFIFTLLIEK